MATGYTAAVRRGIELPEDAGPAGFDDAGSIAEYVKDAVDACRKAGLARGRTEAVG